MTRTRRAPAKQRRKVSKSSEASSDPVTVGDCLRFYAPGVTRPEWPPDVFGVVIMLLHRSGAYTCAVDDWPPQLGKLGKRNDAAWAKRMRRIGLRWRSSVVSAGRVPREVQHWWEVLWNAQSLPVAALEARQDVREALLMLCAAADEASHGVGIPSRPTDPRPDLFETVAAGQLQLSNSLCRQVDPSRLAVLPKLHTPQSGLTVRSLSHHLAVCLTGDFTPQWQIVPSSPIDQNLNLLLVPWPYSIRPSQFKTWEGDLRNMNPEALGFLRFDPSGGAGEGEEQLRKLIERADWTVGRIHGVVFPELALTPELLKKVRKLVVEERKLILVAGVAGAENGFATNSFEVHVPLPASSSASTFLSSPLVQRKHHRWKLDRSQILQYGLGSALDPNVQWWEHISLRDRRLTFLAFNPWLTVCVLLCEDLARQDPIAQVVRAVGPNLVIALLMDGPQLAARWPARYATVLADDPGSSVLTLTSLGMARMSRPPGKGESRSIALWKDARGSGPTEILLPEGHQAVVISLVAETATEWTSDGRPCGGTSRFPVLGGVHPIQFD
jgi:hypothetical protein